jgi:hypothetical protein
VQSVPPEVEAELATTRAAQRRAATRAGFFTCLGLGLLGTWIIRVHHVWPMLLFSGCALATAVFCAYVTWRRKPPDWIVTAGLAPLASLTMMSLFPSVGPMKTLPVLAVAMAAVFATTTPRVRRPFIAITGVITVLLPLLGSWVGLLPESFRFVDEGLLLLPLEEAYHPFWTPLAAAVVFAAAVIVTIVFVGSMHDRLVRLSERNALQTWNLKQMLPPEAAEVPATPSSTGS